MHAAPESAKTPPHSLEAEQAVLGGLFIDPAAWERIADKLQDSDFYLKAHQLIFKAIVQLTSDEQPIDYLTVFSVLQKWGYGEDIRLELLSQLAQHTPTAANIVAYAELVKERSILRTLITLSAHMSEGAFGAGGRSAAELLDEMERKVLAIAEHTTRGQGPQAIRHVVGRALDLIETRMQDGNPLTGISSGFTEIDRLTAGLQPSDLVIVAGRPSMGKTSFAMNIAEHAAIRSGKSVLVFSMEMSGEALATRMIASLGRIDQTRLRNGKLNDEDWMRVANAVGWLKKAHLYIDETPALSPIELRARARRVAREGVPLGLIVVDYLQLMRVQSATENRTAEISEISRSLKALAKELNVPIIALSQLNRSLEQRPNKRPVMSDLRESGAIEQDADLITFIYRDEVYHEDSPDKGTAEIIIAKQRNGPIGTVKLTFLGSYTRFENFISEHSFVAA